MITSLRCSSIRYFSRRVARRVTRRDSAARPSSVARPGMLPARRMASSQDLLGPVTIRPNSASPRALRPALAPLAGPPASHRPGPARGPGGSRVTESLAGCSAEWPGHSGCQWPGPRPGHRHGRYDHEGIMMSDSAPSQNFRVGNTELEPGAGDRPSLPGRAAARRLGDSGSPPSRRQTGP